MKKKKFFAIICLILILIDFAAIGLYCVGKISLEMTLVVSVILLFILFVLPWITSRHLRK